MPDARFELICEKGPDLGRKWPLNKAETVVGRDATCDVVLQDEFTSRRHARILESDGGHVLANLSSVGTTLNGKAAEKSVLGCRHVIELGPDSRRRYQSTTNKPVTVSPGAPTKFT